jgi:superfamily II DNA or RNA helicase
VLDAPRSLWPHQAAAVREILGHIKAGIRRIVLSSPTGGGKTEIVKTLIKLFWMEREWRSIVLSNRKLLVEQLERSLSGLGLDVGVRAAGRAKHSGRPVQVSSIQTEDARVYKRTGYLKWELFPANVVFVDEAHLQNGKMADRLKADYAKAGAVIIEVTATPMDLDGKAEVLVQAGVNSELRACGALVLARHYGPDEPDLRHIGRQEFTKAGDLSEEEQRSLMGKVGEDGKPTLKLQKLFGRVLERYDEYNPERKPGILFAPGVDESRWFAQEFSAAGIAAAHIDGEEIWTAGSGDVKTSEAARKELLEMSRDGTVKLLCNRFVLREGIDCPWLQHGVFATPFGSLSSYLQSGGRLLRAHPGLESVTVQDHGGNWWRHGSLNADRRWQLGATSRQVAGGREDRLRNPGDGDPPEPFRCPRCAAIMVSQVCVCGFAMRHRVRPVVMEDGRLVMMEGNIFRPRVAQTKPDTNALWQREFWKARNKGKTFTQAIGNFYQLHGYWPPTDLPNMPKDRDDKYLKVKDVAREKLICEDHGPPAGEAA